jgi:ComF family protein
MPLCSALASFVRPIFEFAYPPICFICEAPLRDGEKKVCVECWRKIRYVQPADELYQEMEARLRATGHIDSLISSFLFEKEGTLQSLIHELKYNGMTSIGVDLGKRLGDRICSVLDISHVNGMVAVPLHRVKKRERGYNQCEWICEGIHDVTGLQSRHGLLRRVRYTRSQTRLTVDERRENVSDAFVLDPPKDYLLRDGVFLIVDDVITTGATIEACAKVLVEGGAKRTIACSVALADRSALP